MSSLVDLPAVETGELSSSQTGLLAGALSSHWHILVCVPASLLQIIDKLQQTLAKTVYYIQ